MLLLSLGSALAADLCIRGAALHPVTAPVIEDGVVVVSDGRITAVGPSDDVRTPEGCEVHEAAVVTPGLLDGLGTAGLTGVQNSTAVRITARSRIPFSPPSSRSTASTRGSRWSTGCSTMA